MDPDQTAPTGAVWSASSLFVTEASETFQQTTKSDDLCCDWRKYHDLMCWLKSLMASSCYFCFS